jgi:hypothetical protein
MSKRKYRGSSDSSMTSKMTDEELLATIRKRLEGFKLVHGDADGTVEYEISPAVRPALAALDALAARLEAAERQKEWIDRVSEESARAAAAADAAESEIERLRRALREIADDTEPNQYSRLQTKARAALGESNE